MVDPVVVNIHVNGDLVASISADRPRADVGIAYRSYGENHGFDYSFPSTIGTKEICVYAANADGGTSTLLGCSRVRVAAGTATGVIESARTREDGSVRVRGWAVLEGSQDPVDVSLMLDGEMAKTVTADRERDDLADTLGELGTEHGFATTIKSGAGAEYHPLNRQSVTSSAAKLLSSFSVEQFAGGVGDCRKALGLEVWQTDNIGVTGFAAMLTNVMLEA